MKDDYQIWLGIHDNRKLQMDDEYKKSLDNSNWWNIHKDIKEECYNAALHYDYEFLSAMSQLYGENNAKPSE